MKKAILVTFVPTTRLVVDIPEGKTLDEWLNTHLDEVSRAAREKMLECPEDYLYGDNIEIQEDTEVPAEADESDDPSGYIPNLKPLLEKVTQYVRNHQGEKGFINTQDGTDMIWMMEYDVGTAITEYHVKALRVTDKGILEMLRDDPYTDWTEEEIRESFDIPDDRSPWQAVNETGVVFPQTLLNIAENISEY